MWICIAPCHDHTSKALGYGMRSQGISVLPAHYVHSANGMNHTCLCLPSWSWYSFTDPRRIEGWVGLGQVVDYIQTSVWHRELNPDTVAHLSTNRARRRLTSLIEANALTTTPDHQLCQTELNPDHASNQVQQCQATGTWQWAFKVVVAAIITLV